MDDYQILEANCRELKEENTMLTDSLQMLKAELGHAKQFEQAINFLKETSLHQSSRISELENLLSKSQASETELSQQLSVKNTKLQLVQSQHDELQAEIERQKFVGDISLHNISSIDNNQQLVHELETKVQVLES